MKTSSIALTSTLLMALIFFAPSAQALTVTAGWIQADVGLDENTAGWFTGIQETRALVGDLIDITVSGEYLKKAGSLSRLYSDPHAGETTGEAKVRLHCFQPAFFLGVRLPVSAFTARLYTGSSVVLNLGESWDEPIGTTALEYGYEELDFQVHAGFFTEISNFVLDIRYSYGLKDQLIVRTGQDMNLQKAEVIETPEDGEKITSLQIGVGYSF